MVSEVSCMVSIVATDGYVLRASVHTQPSTDTSHDDGPEAKPGCWCIGSSGGDAGKPARAAMAKPTDPERTAGVSALVAVALVVSGDGAGGRE